MYPAVFDVLIFFSFVFFFSFSFVVVVVVVVVSFFLSVLFAFRHDIFFH